MVTPALTPVAAPQTPIHTQSKETFTGKQLKVGFDDKTGQTVQVRSRASPDKNPGQPILYTWMNPVIPLYLYFPHFFLPKSPKSLLCPAFDSSHKDSIISPVQSPKALPLPPLMGPTLPASNPLCPKGNLESCSP